MADSRRFGGDETKALYASSIKERKQAASLKFSRLRTLISLVKDQASRGRISYETLQRCLGVLLSDTRRRFPNISLEKKQELERDCALFLGLSEQYPNFLTLIQEVDSADNDSNEGDFAEEKGQREEKDEGKDSTTASQPSRGADPTAISELGAGTTEKHTENGSREDNPSSGNNSDKSNNDGDKEAEMVDGNGDAGLELMANDEKALKKLRIAIWNAQVQDTISAVQACILDDFLSPDRHQPRAPNEGEEEGINADELKASLLASPSISNVRINDSDVRGTRQQVLLFKCDGFDGGGVSVTVRAKLGASRDAVSKMEKVRKEGDNNARIEAGGTSSVNIAVFEAEGLGFSDYALLNTWLAVLIQQNGYNNIANSNQGLLLLSISIISHRLAELISGEFGAHDRRAAIKKLRRLKPLSNQRAGHISMEIVGVPSDLKLLDRRSRSDVSKDVTVARMPLLAVEEAVRKQLVDHYETKRRRSLQKYNQMRAAWKKGRGGNRRKGTAPRTSFTSAKWEQIVHLESVARGEAIKQFSECAQQLEREFQERVVDGRYEGDGDEEKDDTDQKGAQKGEKTKQKKKKKKESKARVVDMLMPHMAFHGTSSRINVDSIAENGVVPPGEFTSDGYLVTTSTGSAFGEGIYTTLNPSVAASYGYYDPHHATSQFFVGLVLPGIPWYCVTSKSRQFPTVKWGQTQKKGFHSHVNAAGNIDGFDVTVIFESRQFLPLFLVTTVRNDVAQTNGVSKALNALLPGHFSEKMNQKTSSKEKAKRNQSLAEEKRLEKKLSFFKKMERYPPGLILYRVPGLSDTWSLRLSSAVLKDLDRRQAKYKRILHMVGRDIDDALLVKQKKQSALNAALHTTSSDGGTLGVHIVYAIDKSQSMGVRGFKRLALPACLEIHNSLSPDSAHAVMFGETVTHTQVKSSQYFSKNGLASKTKLEPGTALMEGFEKAVELVVNTHSRAQEDADRSLREQLVGLELLYDKIQQSTKVAQEGHGGRGGGVGKGRLTNRERKYRSRLSAASDRIDTRMADVRVAQMKLIGSKGPGRVKARRRVFLAIKSLNNAFRARDRLKSKHFHREKILERGKRRDDEKNTPHNDGKDASEGNQNVAVSASTEIDKASASSLLDVKARVDKTIRRNKQYRLASVARTLKKQDEESLLVNGCQSLEWEQERVLAKEARTSYVIVVLSDGCETVSTTAKIEAGLQRVVRVMQQGGIRLIVKIVGIGRYADTQLLIKQKLAAQTVSLFETTPVHYAPKRKNLLKVVHQLCAELRTNLCSQPLTVRVEEGGLESRSAASEGMLHTIGDIKAVHSIQTRLRKDGKPTILCYRGKKVPKRLLVGPRTVAIYEEDAYRAGGWRSDEDEEEGEGEGEEEEEKEKEEEEKEKEEKEKEEKEKEEKDKKSKASSSSSPSVEREAMTTASASQIEDWLLLLRDGVQKVKMRAVAQEGNLLPIVKNIKRVTKSIKSAGYDSKMLAKMHPTERQRLMRGRRALTHNLESLSNGLEDMVRLAGTMTSDEMARWLNKVSSMKYGAKALRRVAAGEPCKGSLTSLAVADDLLKRVERREQIAMERKGDDDQDGDDIELGGQGGGVSIVGTDSDPANDRNARITDGSNDNDIGESVASTTSIEPAGRTETETEIAAAEDDAENLDGADRIVKLKEQAQIRARLVGPWRSFIDGVGSAKCWEEIKGGERMREVVQAYKLLQHEQRELERQERKRMTGSRRAIVGAKVKLHLPTGEHSSKHGNLGLILNKRGVGSEASFLIRLSSAVGPPASAKKMELRRHQFKVLPDKENPATAVTKDSRYERLRFDRELTRLKASLTPLDLLCAFGMLGNLVSVQRSEAAVINPWAVQISYVSHDKATTNSACAALDHGLPLHDQKGVRAADVLVLANPRNPEPYLQFVGSRLHDLYLSLVFTRSLDISLPAQRTALLMVALARSLEQLLPPPRAPARSRSPSPANKKSKRSGSRRGSRSPSRDNRRKNSIGSGATLDIEFVVDKDAKLSPGTDRYRQIETALQILYTLRRRLLNERTRREHSKAPSRKAMKHSSRKKNAADVALNEEKRTPAYWRGIIEKLSGAHPERHLTETKEDDIASVVKPLGALLCLNQGISLFRRTRASSTSEEMDDGDNAAPTEGPEEGAGQQYHHINPNVRKLALALLAESTSREARVFVKSKIKAFEEAKKEEEAKKAKRAAADTKKQSGKLQADEDFEGDPTLGLAPSHAAAHHILIRALGISLSSCTAPKADGEAEPNAADLVHSPAFDDEKALRHAKRFFSSKGGWTNCSVRSVLASLTFAQALTDFLSRGGDGEEGGDTAVPGASCDNANRNNLLIVLDRILEKGSAGDHDALVQYLHRCMAGAKLGRFVRSLAPGHSAKDVQTALFAQGVFAHDSGARKDGNLPTLTDPRKAVEAISQTLRSRVYNARLRKKIAREKAILDNAKKSSRVKRLKIRQSTFLHNHRGLPTLFSHSELDALTTKLKARYDDNKAKDDKRRDEDNAKAVAAMTMNTLDGVEDKGDKYARVVSSFVPPSLTGSGLLRHRCAWRTCPFYLQSFATKEDLIHGTRVGLFRHLAPLRHPKRLYVGGLHLVAKSSFLRHKGREAPFKREMLEYILTQGDRDVTKKERQALVEILYNDLKSKADRGDETLESKLRTQ